MASAVQQSWASAQDLEKALQAKLAEKDPTFTDIDELITRLRQASEDLIFLDFRFAKSKNAEARLWDAHSKINARFRKNLARFRDENGKKKPVELRKMMKYYLAFIKASQRFYRGYILRLATVFKGIPELEEVAHQFKSDDSVAVRTAQVTAEDRHLVLVSCHQTLVRLGDLSRYRETEINTKDRNWGPATGYYDLAGAIYPASGASHNQLAVIALADGNHLRATYHLYRALAVDEPHPTAKGNLEIEFKKILAAWSKGELIVSKPTAAEGSDAGKALIAWFIRLHARCYRGQDFAEHEELESEVLSQLAVDLKERSLDATLHKFILINVAAEYSAGVRVQVNPESQEGFQAFFFFLRLNVKTFFTLLQVLQPELEQLVVDDSNVQNVTSTNGQGKTKEKRTERMTAVTRRVLPGLRHYSSWLVADAALLVAQVGDSSLNVQVKEMWKIYANSLTLLAATFPAETLPVVEYLLEEDEDTIGFKPFNSLDSSSRRRRYSQSKGQARKPRMHDSGIERRHPNEEMLSRVRDFLMDGLELAIAGTAPIVLADGCSFTYQEEGLPSSEVLASPVPANHQPLPLPSSEAAANATNQPSIAIPLASKPDAGLNDDTASSDSPSMSRSMQRMVSSLVDTDAVSWPPTPEPQPPLPPSLTHPTAAVPSKRSNQLTASELLSTLPYQTSSASAAFPYSSVADPPLSAHSSKQHTPRPSLPSIYNTPFAPQPDEAEHSPSPSNNTREATLVSQQKTQQQIPQHQSSGLAPPSSCLFPDTPGLNFDPTTTGLGAARGENFSMMGGGHDSSVYGGASAFDDPSVVAGLSRGVGMPVSPYWSSAQFAGRGRGRSGAAANDGNLHTPDRHTRTGAGKGQSTPPAGQGYRSVGSTSSGRRG